MVTSMVAINTRTSFIMAEEMVDTIEAIRDRMPTGEKAMTYSVILSIISFPSPMSRITPEARSPSASRATPRNRQKMIIWSMLALAMD